MADHYYVEYSPGYVRLRHKLGIETRLWSVPRSGLAGDVLDELDAREEAGERIVVSRGQEDADEYQEYLEWRAEEDYVAALEPEEAEAYLAERKLAMAKKAVEDRLGRGARGMSERSRREMWRWVLSLPFEMLGERPLWITLTYPGDWRPWVPDGATFERHRRAFAEAWCRRFGERALGFWSKEFQLQNGRPHLHLLVKGPDSMSDRDYRGFQALTGGTRTCARWARPRGAGGRRRSGRTMGVIRRQRFSGRGHI